jgi:Fic-DOC domain mobile mystery protein B
VKDSAVKVLGDRTLRRIALELVDAVRKNASIDWAAKESVRAKMRAIVKRILRAHGYPPELIPAHIAYRRELNEAEQEKISRAQDWALNRRRDPLSEKFVKELHRRMFGEVWRWAGRFRMSERNLGIVFHEIPVVLRQLLDDTRTWIEYRTYSPDEIAMRFHHRLVLIYPFPNGNGRHARLMADLVVMRLGGERFSWGSVNLQDAGSVRQRYIAALQATDDHEIGPLLAFARS